MSVVRVLARESNHTRCAWCHGSALEEAAACAGCGVLVHAECRAQLVRCPTLGCPTLCSPDGQGRLAAAPRRWARARFEARLVLSLAWHLLLFLGAIAALAAGALSIMSLPRAFGDPAQLLLALLGLAVGGAGLFGAPRLLDWLIELPGHWSEAARLLSTEPVPMLLGWSPGPEARLLLRPGPNAPRWLRPIEVGPFAILTPGWALPAWEGEPVRVWVRPLAGGVTGKGAVLRRCLVQSESGELALLHP